MNMDTFNIIAGVASIVSFFMTLFVAMKVIKIANTINVKVDSTRKINQRVSGEGNKVSAGDMGNV